MPFKILLFALLTVFASAPAAHADLRRLRQVDAGVFRGDQPDNEADYDKLQSLGIKTILNLRRTPRAITKEREIAKARGLYFIHAPISALYSVVLPPSRRSVERALATLTNPALQPVYVHCAEGKDRTGFIAALYRVLYQHWNPRDAVDEMYSMGFAPFFRGLEDDFWRRVSIERRSDMRTSELAAAFE